MEERHETTYEGSLATLTVGASHLTATAGHPFWVIDGEDLEARPAPDHVGPDEDRGGYLYGRWVKAEDLRAGDVIFQKSGGPGTLRAVRLYQASTPVCNLTVKDLHTFAVGEAQVLAHNAKCSVVQRLQQWAGGLWTGTKNRTPAQNAFKHFKDHGADFGAKNAVDYTRQAKTFLQNPPAGTLTKGRPNGDVVRYNPATDFFGVMDKNGTPRTFYKPDPLVHGCPTNLDYFYAQ